MTKSMCNCNFGAKVIRGSNNNQSAKCDNIWIAECFNAHGHKQWETTWHNLVTTEGRNHLLNAGLKSGSTFATWYISLFEDDYTPTASDTYAVPGFNETTAYDEANRVTWQAGTVASSEVSNSANKASFTFNATKNIYGGALVSFATKDDVAEAGAVMYASGRFDSTKPVDSGDIVKITTTIGLTIS